MKDLLLILAAGIVALTPTAALAGPRPWLPGLPQCIAGAAQDACDIYVPQGYFDSLAGWTRKGDVWHGYDEYGYASQAHLGAGASIRQTVPVAGFGTSADARYLLTVQIRGLQGDGQVVVAFSATDSAGNAVRTLGSATAIARDGTWAPIEIEVKTPAGTRPEAIAIHVANQDHRVAVAVDDVRLYQWEDRAQR